jgi:hypothetical protein
MPKFEVKFCDDKTVVLDVDTADVAKARARAQRRSTVPPDTPRSAPEVKIASVTRIGD